MRGRARGTSITYLTLNIPNNCIPRIWSLDVYGRYCEIGASRQYILREVGVDVVYTTYILNVTKAYLMRYSVYDIAIYHYND